MSQGPLHILCVEPRFPGRLGGVADWLVRKRGYHVRFFCHQLDPRETWPATVGAGIELVQFAVGGVAREPSVAWTRGLERGLCYAYGAWEVFDARRPRPIDLVLARSAGLGSSLFSPVTYPRVPVVNLFDYYFHPHANDLAGDDIPLLPPEYIHWRRAANAMDLLDLENGDVAWTHSRWQRGLYPIEYRNAFNVIHDGIDLHRLAGRVAHSHPRKIAGRAIPAGAKVVTFVARRLDRLRGFDRFTALASRLLRERSDVICVAVGGGPVDRMLDVRHHGQDFGALALAQNPPADPERFWDLGFVEPGVVSVALAASDLHIVASRPYPVARSTFEAMAAGAVLLVWDTEPAREFITPERALLVAPDDPDAAARSALAALDDIAGVRPLARAGEAFVREHLDRDATLPELAVLFDAALDGGAGHPPSAG